MREGLITRLMRNGCGFLQAGTGPDVFFHAGIVRGVEFDTLQEGQRVHFEEDNDPSNTRGPRARRVFAGEPVTDRGASESLG